MADNEKFDESEDGSGERATADAQELADGQLDADGRPVGTDFMAAELPALEETHATELLSNKHHLKAQLRRLRRSAFVVVHRAGMSAVRLPMSHSEMSFGRDGQTCDIVLDGEGVSRVHAKIVRDEFGNFILTDCGSTNGTIVDGRPVSKMNLADGDIFEIGEHRLEFGVLEEGESAPRIDPDAG